MTSSQEFMTSSHLPLKRFLVMWICSTTPKNMFFVLYYWHNFKVWENGDLLWLNYCSLQGYWQLFLLPSMPQLFYGGHHQITYWWVSYFLRKVVWNHCSNMGKECHGVWMISSDWHDPTKQCSQEFEQLLLWIPHSTWDFGSLALSKSSIVVEILPVILAIVSCKRLCHPVCYLLVA